MHKDKPVPHVHAEVIKQWAIGEEIQFSFNNKEWRDCSNNSPTWDIRNFYRVKPKPPKVIELYANADCDHLLDTEIFLGIRANVLMGNFSKECIETDNLKLTFCPITGKLIGAEVVKHNDYKKENEHE